MKQKAYQFWFATGSQDLYGEACLRDVAEHAGIITGRLNASGLLPYEVVLKPVLIDKCFHTVFIPSGQMMMSSAQALLPGCTHFPLQNHGS